MRSERSETKARKFYLKYCKTAIYAIKKKSFQAENFTQKALNLYVLGIF